MKNKEIIRIIGAKENNLKNINIDIPKNQFVVMTGLSGSGKSSLAFDTLYQEGQRRYVESLSAYARQFLGSFEKPKVDAIEGLSPSISIDQRTTSQNPRSTVGTVTEIYDFYRLIYAKIGVPYCPNSDKPLTKQTIQEMTDITLGNSELKDRIIVLAPVVIRQKGTHANLIEKFLKDGFNRAIIDDEEYLLEEAPALDRNKNHSISIVVDRLIRNDEIKSRLYESLELATRIADGKAIVKINDNYRFFNEKYACEDESFVIPELETRLFSFNTPLGACPSCNGLGVKLKMDLDLVLAPDKPLVNGGFIPYKNTEDDNLNIQELEQVAKHYNIDILKPVSKLTKKELDIFLYGTEEEISFMLISSSGRVHSRVSKFEGLINHLERRHRETTSEWIREWLEGFMREIDCEVCGGKRLNPAALSVRVGGTNIYELTTYSVDKTLEFFENLKLTQTEREIAKLALEEIKTRLIFLKNVGLGYLTLSRRAGTLSGGEAQRIRLATQIGSKLSGVLYVLDEPSIGLHQRDNIRLINALKEMRDLGNTLIVVEHDHETMLSADHLIDIGPGAGDAGGYIVAQGTPAEVMANNESITGRYLSGKEFIEVPKKRRKLNGSYINIKGAAENNLKDLDVDIPLGLLTVVSGVSGSGKSTLVNTILLNGLRQKYYKSKVKPGKHQSLDDHELINKVVEISQSPIGRTPRSNPVTYTGVFDDIRDVFALTKEAQVRGYKKGRFSFNVKGGRCETCQGDGVKRISMHFLPDVYVKCEVCEGKRYNHETLQIKYRGKTISDILEMTVDDAVEFFKNHRKIHGKLLTMKNVGLGYIKLGQPAPTLSGGEAQRVKLASELQKRITPQTIFILDEPTTGLHTDDVKRLLKVLQTIVDEGATMVIIEHNLDVIKSADYIIDLGPEGGDKGGTIVATGTPEEIAKVKESYTGQYLKPLLK
ncbi:MAG: excinuclease ABC subunit UvrA [Acholeplasmataceae bacterium]|jgi:excinuclease ABC subunit A